MGVTNDLLNGMILQEGMSIPPLLPGCQATVLRDIYGNQTLISGATGATVTRCSPKNELLYLL